MGMPVGTYRTAALEGGHFSPIEGQVREVSLKIFPFARWTGSQY